MDSDLTTQAALTLTRASQTNNFVNSKAYYDISFRTATAGAIKTVEMDFPAGTYTGAALLVEATGIGPGTISQSTPGTLIYTVTNAVNVPANTIIRIQISNINNPTTPSSSLTVTITTRNPANAIIDGPTVTPFPYNIKQVGTNDIAENSITSTKPAASFMKRVTLRDDPAGNALGWNPNGATKSFVIEETTTDTFDSPFFNLEVISINTNENYVCDVVDHLAGATFIITCITAPVNGDELHYVVGNLPGNLICPVRPCSR